MDIDLQPVSATERAKRSVFVGNIPYEATEEALKEIFQQAGQVVSFRLVYDRETGKPKGYGFCEYQDIETAHSALRNLNNTDFNGRPLRVGVAAGESNKDEMASMQQALGGPVLESPYGDPVEPEKAPEAISKAVASLPPEQMFELMKQMKLCIQNNPTEARNMLLQNPQLAYALLQAQIVMKIVDPQVAMAMLHRESSQIPPPSSSIQSVPPSQSHMLQQPQIIPQPQATLPDPSMMGMRGPGPMMGGPQGPPVSTGMMVGPPRGPGMMGPSGPMGGPQGPMGGPQGPMGGPQGPMGGPQGPIGGLVGGPQVPMGAPRPGQQFQQPSMGGPGVGGPQGQGPPMARDPRILGQGDSRGMPIGPSARPGMPPSGMQQGMMQNAGMGGGAPNMAGMNAAMLAAPDQEKSGPSLCRFYNSQINR